MLILLKFKIDIKSSKIYLFDRKDRKDRKVINEMFDKLKKKDNVIESIYEV